MLNLFDCKIYNDWEGKVMNFPLTATLEKNKLLNY